MAKAVVDTEFPDFLVVTAFCVFALADANKAVGEVAVDQTHCQRLAKLFSVDATQTNSPGHQEQHAVQQS